MTSGIDAGIRVGKYEVGRKLGQGGFGILYVARDHELGREIAIKFLRPEHAFKPTVVQRFLQEARAAARINHPGIVTVFESGLVAGTNTRADGTVFIAMELLAGDTLAQKIRGLGRLPTTLAINYARQLASALGAAHQAGIVHRDLKPPNVFVVPDAAVVGGERLKVLDFGIAKLADDFGSGMQTHSMLMLGTPMYMSPEQCKSSAKVDARSDIYSLGCILFEMLSGKPPFDGDSGELIAKHQLVPPPTMRSVISDIPVPLDRLIASMLAKSPADRPQTMGLVEDALAEIDSRAVERPSIAGEDLPAMEAYAPTTIEPSAMRKRLPLVAGAAGAAALGIMAGLLAMCGDKKPAAQANVARDASIIAEAAPDAVELTPDAMELTVAPDAAVAEEPVPPVDQIDPSITPARVTTKSPTKPATKTPAKAKTAKTTDVKPPVNCDADGLKDKGMENVNMGQHAAALAQFEASLRCKPDSYVLALAFMAACNAQNVAKAKSYYLKISPPERERYKVMCVRNHINPGD